MKLIFSTILIFASVVLFAQNKSSIEIYASPNYANFTNKLVNDDGAISYNFGIGYNFSSDEKWNLTAGLRVSDFVTKYTNNSLRWGSQHNGQGGHDPTIPSGESITGITFKNHYYFLEVPIGIKYRLLDKKIKLFVEPTINPAMFLTHRNDITKRYEQEPDELEISSGGYSALRKFNFFGEIGLGAEMALGDKINLQLRPSARMQLLSAVENSTTHSKLYSVGIKLGVRYRLSE